MIFNAISAAEMAALPKELQLDLLADFHLLPEDMDNLDASRFGKVQRGGRKLLVAGPKITGSTSKSIRKVSLSIACCTRIRSETFFFAPASPWMRRTNSLEARRDSGN